MLTSTKLQMPFSGGRALRSWSAASRLFLNPNLPANARAAVPTALTGALIVTLDQIVKTLLASYLESQAGYQVWIVEPVVKLRLVHNSGFVFGLFSDSAPAWLVSLVVVGAIGAILLVFTRQIESPSLATRIVFGLTFGGAIGNLIDRFRFGYVIDYVDFGWWPVFNIADSAINISIVAFVVLLLLGRVEKRPAAPSPFME